MSKEQGPHGRSAQRRRDRHASFTRRELLKAMIPGRGVYQAIQAHGDLSQFSTPDKVALAKDAVLAIATVGGIRLLPDKPTITLPTPTATSPETKRFPTSVILDNEIKRLGITFSPKERALWDNGLTRARSKEMMSRQLENFIDYTLELMAQSENPIFKTASEDYKRLRDDGLASHAVVPVRENQGYSAITKPQFRNNKIHSHTSYADVIVQRRDPHSLALLLAHEIEHARGMLRFDASLAETTSIPDRIFLHSLRGQNQRETIEEEARGWGIQVQAFIYSYELTYYSMEPRFITIAEQFVQCGNTRDNACWRSYVEKDILKIAQEN